MTTLPGPDGVLLLHNPRCSKSRATRELLEAQGVAFDERLYLEAPLAPEELAEVVRRLGVSPADIIRSKESAYADASLSSSSSPAELLAAIAAAPILLERPIVIRGSRAAIGRPPEAVLRLFE